MRRNKEKYIESNKFKNLEEYTLDLGAPNEFCAFENLCIRKKDEEKKFYVRVHVCMQNTHIFNTTR